MNGATETPAMTGCDQNGSAGELLPRIYGDLRKLAAWKLAGEPPGQTLQATALVHEAYMRLGGRDEWDSQRHFFAAIAENMRRILIENARRRKCVKHGGHLEQVDLDDVDIQAPMPDDELLEVDEALDRLAEVNPRAAELVKLCYFAGLTQDKAADQLGVSISTAKRLWAFARAWLYREIQPGREGELNPNTLMSSAATNQAQEIEIHSWRCDQRKEPKHETETSADNRVRNAWHVAPDHHRLSYLELHRRGSGARTQADCRGAI
jgi:RNA polymerase sigma factor (TIGR02999 family)